MSVKANNHNKDIQEVVYSDGCSALGFWFIPSEVDGFMLIASDGGGYTSIGMDAESWEKAKAKIDELVKMYVISSNGKA